MNTSTEDLYEHHETLSVFSDQYFIPNDKMRFEVKRVNALPRMYLVYISQARLYTTFAQISHTRLS